MLIKQHFERFGITFFKFRYNHENTMTKLFIFQTIQKPSQIVYLKYIMFTLKKS